MQWETLEEQRHREEQQRQEWEQYRQELEFWLEQNERILRRVWDNGTAGRVPKVPGPRPIVEA